MEFDNISFMLNYTDMVWKVSYKASDHYLHRSRYDLLGFKFYSYA